ncbi:MAG: GGDEF domain-containing protein [Treponema sp.]|nr:GGDEF domain-containing protein [Treponema sp.]
MDTSNKVAFFIDFAEPEYSLGLIEGARAFFKKQGMEMIIFETGNINSPSKTYGYQRLSIASLISANTVSGMIFVSGPQLYNATPEYLESYLKSFAPIKIVSIGYDFPQYPCVISSCKKSMKELIEHLIVKHSCKKIALLTVNSHANDVQLRTEIYRQVMAEQNLEENIIYANNLGYAQTVEALKDVSGKSSKFDAIVCMNDEMACACIDTLTSAGISVPKKVIVTGFDDEMRSSCITPSLTTINQNIYKQGYAAAKMLYDQIKGNPVPHKKVIESTVIYRESCRCISGDMKRWLYLDSKGSLHESTLKDISSFEISKWFTNRNHFIRITQIYTNMQADIPLDVLSRRVRDDFTSFGIQRAALCFFKNPVATDKFEYFSLPQEAYVFSAYDNSTEKSVYYNEDKITFNPNETLVPDGLLSSFEDLHVVALYKNTILYGYAVYKRGPYDPTIYSISFKMISSTIANAFTTNKVLKEFELVKTVSMTDEMTGLLNRRGFMTLGKTMLVDAIKHGKGGVMLFGDIDGLKKINDTYGHSCGDKAIRAEASILKEIFGKDCTVGRLGGDEFAVIAPKLSMEKFEAVNKKIKEKCGDYNKKSGEKFTLSISIGCVPFGKKTSSSMHELLALADKELYKAKEAHYAEEG